MWGPSSCIVFWHWRAAFISLSSVQRYGALASKCRWLNDNMNRIYPRSLTVFPVLGPQIGQNYIHPHQYVFFNLLFSVLWSRRPTGGRIYFETIITELLKTWIFSERNETYYNWKTWHTVNLNLVVLVYQSGTVFGTIAQFSRFVLLEYDKGYNRRRTRKCLQIIF